MGSNLTIERDEVAQELDRVTHHRDASLELEEEDVQMVDNAAELEEEEEEDLEEVQGVSDVDSNHFDA